METEKKTPETETKPAKRKYDGRANMQPCRDHETAIQRGRAGGIKSGESKRRKKTMKESLLLLLESQYTKTKAKEIVGAENIENLSGDYSIQNLINFKMLQEAIEGNTKAYELIRDTSGNKPATDINLDAEIITDKDKQLLEALTKPEKS